MKLEHLEERVNDYRESIKTVFDKKIQWESITKKLIIRVLKNTAKNYNIGWKVQELNWIYNNEAVNIIFDSFPSDLIDFTNKVPTYQFIQGGALVFSQSYSGDVYVLVLFPYLEQLQIENRSVELGFYNPADITEKLIVEKVDEFLKEMIKWEVPSYRTTLGFHHKEI
jgi:hypothetical protein